MRLKAEEQTQLRALLKVDQAPTRKLTHARILLKADQHASGMHDKQAEQAGKTVTERRGTTEAARTCKALQQRGRNG